MPSSLLQRSRAVGAGLLAGLAFGGCASTENRDAASRPAPADDYVYITETGSHIARRVRRSQAQSSTSTSRVETLTGEEATERINHMPMPPRRGN